MNNPLRHPEQINPKIAADVQAALEKNRAAGRVVDGDFADSVASSSLADIVKADTDEVKETRGLADSGLEQVINPEVRRSFETAFKGAEQLFARISLTPPTPEEFMFVGVDFARLEKEFERMAREGLEPSLVISPTLPLTKEVSMGIIKGWQNIYDFLAADTTILNNPLRKQTDGNGLYVAGDVSDNAKNLFQQEIQRISDSPDIHHTYVASNDRDRYRSDLPWIVTLLPTTDKPQELGTPHTLHETANDPAHSKLATISQYLTLQATRIQSGLPPIDQDTYSWIQGTFNDGSGPCGRWSLGSGQVRMAWHGVGRSSDGIGVRLPVWG